jgi:hypothetical protein
MSRTPNKIIGSLTMALVVGATLAPSAGAASDAQSSGGLGRTPTEIGQAVGEPGEGTGIVQTDAQQSNASSSGLGRTSTELGQAIGEPGESTGAIAAQPGGNQTVSSSDDESGGIDGGVAAAVAGGLALLAGIGGLALTFRRRGTLRKSRTPVPSS